MLADEGFWSINEAEVANVEFENWQNQTDLTAIT
jgi:hypothetical protein